MSSTAIEPQDTVLCELIGGSRCGDILKRDDAPNEITIDDGHRYRKTDTVVNGLIKYQLCGHPHV